MNRDLNGNTHNDGVTVVIVSYNSDSTIGRCLESLLGTLRVYDEVVIVDNASQDRSLDVIQSHIKNDARFNVLPNETNTGYSAAANQGAKTGENPYLVFLNPDTIVLPHWIERLIYHLQPAETAAVGPLSDCVAGGQYLGLYLTEKQMSQRDIQAVADHMGNKYRRRCIQTKLLIGFCLMIKREFFNLLGGLDENLFLGNDDLDLSWRLQKKGYGLAIAMDALVLHEGQASFASQAKTYTNGLIQESTDFLAYKLLAHYGQGNVPSAQDLWSIDWFKPTCRFESYKPLTSMVMLTFNQIEYTKQCIRSIFDHTRIPFELIVVDNGSSDGTLAYLESLKRSDSACMRIKVIANHSNTGFARGCNQGIAVARGSYIVLINNDVVVTSGWLTQMIDTAEQTPAIGLVGPMTNNVSGPQRVPSVSYDIDNLQGLESYALEFAKKNDRQQLENWRLAGFCLLIKRAVIQKIGGLDPRYGIGNFEDDDFCIRANLAGFSGCIAGNCFVHHFGSKTFLGNGIDFDQQLLKNWQQFKDKWGIDPKMPYQQTYYVPIPSGGFVHHKHYITIDDRHSLNNPTDASNRASLSSVKPPYTKFHWSMSPVAPHSSTENPSTGDKSMTVLDDVFASTVQYIAPKMKAEAAWILARIVEADPQHSNAHHELGLLYYELEEYANAETHLMQSVALEQENASFLKDLADFKHVVNNDAVAAREYYSQAVKLNPGDRGLLITLAHLCTTQRDFEQAAQYYRMVIADDPSHAQALECLQKVETCLAEATSEPDIEDRYAEAQAKAQAGEISAAMADLEHLLSENPAHALALNDLGVLAYEQGDKTAALHHYRKAVELAPDNMTLLKNLGDFHWVETQDAEAALKCYIKVLNKSPEDLETLLNCGQICIALGQDSDAQTFVERARDVAPENETAQALWQQLQQGSESAAPSSDTLRKKASDLAANGDIQGAIGLLTDIVTRYPDDACAYNDLGVLHYEAGDLAKALSSYRQAVAREPGQVTYLKNLADFYLMEQGRAQEAMQLYVQVLEKNPLDIDSLFATGVICAKLEKDQDAETFFQRVLEIEPNHAPAHQAIKNLNREPRKKSGLNSCALDNSIRPQEAHG